MKKYFLFLIPLFLVGCGLIDYEPGGTSALDELCMNAGGHWNECSNKCHIDNPGGFCTEVCEPLCECGTIDSIEYTCPDNMLCNQNEVTGMGYCINETTPEQ